MSSRVEQVYYYYCSAEIIYKYFRIEIYLLRSAHGANTARDPVGGRSNLDCRSLHCILYVNGSAVQKMLVGVAVSTRAKTSQIKSATTPQASHALAGALVVPPACCATAAQHAQNIAELGSIRLPCPRSRPCLMQFLL